MSENKTKHYDWQKATAADGLRFRKPSPNLVAINDYLCKRWGGSNVGIFVKRPIRGGVSPSSHSFGAALDWRYGDTVGNRHKVETDVLPWLIENSHELGVQAIHDYYGCRVWKSVRVPASQRGWRTQTAGSQGGAMGAAWAKWLHIETTKQDWKDGRRVDDRLSLPTL